MAVEWKDGFFHATLEDLDNAIRAGGGTVVEWKPSEEDVKAAAASVASAVDSIILGRVHEFLEDKKASDSTDDEGESWRDRPPLL